MLDGARSKDTASRLKLSNNVLISFLNVATSVPRNDRQETTVLINGYGSLTNLNKTLLNASVVILLSKAWRLMNDAGTSVCADVIGGNNGETLGAFFLFFEVIEERIVLSSLKFFTLKGFQDSGLGNLALLAYVVETSFHAHVNFIVRIVLELNVFEVGVHGERQV